MKNDFVNFKEDSYSALVLSPLMFADRDKKFLPSLIDDKMFALELTHLEEHTASANICHRTRLHFSLLFSDCSRFIDDYPLPHDLLTSTFSKPPAESSLMRFA